MKRNLLFIIALFVCTVSFGQGEIDAYRYSNDDLSGTARGQAMGGAFGALGGDVTGVAINPAGIGIYRTSEILANMSLSSPIISGNTNQQSNTAFHFDNLSYIGYYPLVTGSMLSLNYGFNYSRIKSFDQQYSTSRPIMNSSMTDYMEHLTNNYNNGNGISRNVWTGNMDDYYFSNNPYPWLSGLAYDGGLIKEGNANNNYQTILNSGERVSPSLKVSEKGKVEAYDFTLGANHANKFYWGATVSIINLSYLMYSFYDESFADGGGFTLGNYLETKGSGFQAKLGVIYKPVDALRFGVSYHSPVWYSMTDYYQGWIDPRGISINGQVARRTETPLTDPDGYSVYTNYNFRTPGSWTFSAAAVLSTKAIVSVDYDIKNYASMNLKDDNGNDLSANDYISSDYRNASTLRAGFEYRFTPQLSGRVGYAWAQSPYQSKVSAFGDDYAVGDVAITAGTVPHYTLSGNVNYLTAGVGFRFTPQFYGDFALVLRTEKDDLYYFTPKMDQVQSEIFDSFAGAFTNKTLKGLITLGYKF